MRVKSCLFFLLHPFLFFPFCFHIPLFHITSIFFLLAVRLYHSETTKTKEKKKWYKEKISSSVQ